MKTLLLYFFLFSISLGLTVLLCHALRWEQERMYNLGQAEQRVRDYDIFRNQRNEIQVLKFRLWNCENKGE